VNFKKKLQQSLNESLSTPDMLRSNVENGYDKRLMNEMIRLATSPARFDSQKEFGTNLSEGLLLNVSPMVSQSLMVPPGEYVVWTTNRDHTTLVPTSDVTSEAEILHAAPSYKMPTSRLLGYWNSMERVIGEAGGFDKTPEDLKKSSNKASSFKMKHPGRIHPIDTKVSSSIEASGKSQQEIADQLGVDKSTISRWTTDHAKAGRRPNLQHAGELASITGSDPDAMFKELSTPASQSKKSNKRKKTSGSGGGRNAAFQQGNTKPGSIAANGKH